MARALLLLEDGALIFTPQATEGITYAQKIDKAEARIDWTKPAADLHNLVRGLAPAPGAFFEAELGKGVERVKVLRTEISKDSGAPGRVLDAHLTIGCGQGALRLLEVQRPGRAPIPAADFLRGVRLGEGALLASKSDAAF
jgi:methionyl-tRNA formyltransferase